MSERRSNDIVFACDVGNTRVGFALVETGKIRQVVHVPLAGLDGLATCFEMASQEGGGNVAAPVVVSSVNPQATERLRETVSRFTSGPFLVARQDFAIPMHVDVERPERVGIDRLLAALAAWRIVCGPVIAVDVGTATTVDAVDGEGRFIGGTILPGPSLGAWALHEKTAALPQVSLDGPVEPLGRNTEMAIRGGLLFGAAGAVERLVSEQRALLGGQALVIGTGGGLDLLKPMLTCLDETRDDLVLEGLVAAFLSSS